MYCLGPVPQKTQLEGMQFQESEMREEEGKVLNRGEQAQGSMFPNEVSIVMEDGMVPQDIFREAT